MKCSFYETITEKIDLDQMKEFTSEIMKKTEIDYFSIFFNKKFVYASEDWLHFNKKYSIFWKRLSLNYIDQKNFQILLDFFFFEKECFLPITENLIECPIYLPFSDLAEEKESLGIVHLIYIYKKVLFIKKNLACL